MKKINTSSQTVRECDVFISYRRDGGDMTAMYFYQALKERGYNVFYDLEVLRAGKFNEALLDSIKSCTDFVVILSPHALDRCSDENDWVRREIAEALRSKKNIIPVMLKGFTFPDSLPEEIEDIRYQNGLTCTTEYFEESINRLCERYLRSLPEGAKKKKPPLIPIIAALVVLAVGIGAFMTMKGKPAAPVPEPTATVEITAVPTDTPESTATPTPEPTATPTPEPTEAPGPLVVKDTDFPVLSHLIDEIEGNDSENDLANEKVEKNAPVLGNPDLRRQDVYSVTFLPSLADAPEDAWDVSEAGDGRVLAWTVPHEKLYELYIAGDGGVKIVDPDGPCQMFLAYTNMERFSLNGCVDLSERTAFYSMFRRGNALKEVDFTGICTENANDMNCMFGGCWELEALDLSGFDTSKVENMNSMFEDCAALTALDITGFDTSRVKDGAWMFHGCHELTELDVSHMDTSKMTDMSDMFERCENLRSLDLSHFDTSRVTKMSEMFLDCFHLESVDVSGFDTSHVTSMEKMFWNCNNLAALDVSGFDTSRCERMGGMFFHCESLLDLDVSGFNTSRVESMSNLFDGCALLDGLEVSGWDTGRATEMNAMFAACPALYRLDLSGWNTSRVTNMSEMFEGDSSLTEALLTGWDVSNVTDMRVMFRNCENLESIGRDPVEFGCGNTAGMYDGCPKLNVY